MGGMGPDLLSVDRIVDVELIFYLFTSDSLSSTRHGSTSGREKSESSLLIN